MSGWRCHRDMALSGLAPKCGISLTAKFSPGQAMILPPGTRSGAPQPPGLSSSSCSTSFSSSSSSSTFISTSSRAIFNQSHVHAFHLLFCCCFLVCCLPIFFVMFNKSLVLPVRVHLFCLDLFVCTEVQQWFLPMASHSA